MDENGHRENGRHKPDHYKAAQTQWMMPQHQIKDHHTIKIMAIVAERDNAIHERNLALSEKKTALAERDMAILQRDAAINERNNAIMERDSALVALARENSVNNNAGSICSPGCASSRGGTKHMNNQHHHVPHIHSPPQLSDAPYNHARDLPMCESYPISAMPENGIKPRQVKRPRKETKTQAIPSKQTSKQGRKGRKGADDLNKQVTIAKSHGEWRSQDIVGGGEDLNKEALTSKHDWKGQDLGLNHVTFDETTMPVPGCSCTGTFRQCYKWGNGGWQSSCCTTTMSMYPLPVIPNKRHARVGGRKMSGSAFTKLLSRLAREGYDLSMPLDLKDHWAKHGTNRYITIK